MDRILSTNEAMAALGFKSRTGLLEAEARGSIPRRIKISASKVGYLESEIKAHLERAIAARDAGK